MDSSGALTLLPLDDNEKMKELLDKICTTGHIPKVDFYELLRYSVSRNYEKLEDLCSVLFAKPVITSRLFDIYNLFHYYPHFKTEPWYTVIKYIAKHFEKISTKTEYLDLPYDRIRPKCTTLFRHLPAFMEKEEHLLQFIISWVNHVYDSRKNFMHRLLELLYIRDVSGTFTKSLIARLFDVNEDLVHEVQTERLRTFVRIKKRTRHFHVEYQTSRDGRWHYVNCHTDGEPIIESRFAIEDGIIFNLRSTYVSALSSVRRFSFISNPVCCYEGFMSGDYVHSIVRTLRSPSFSTQSPLDLVSTKATAGIYVYLSQMKGSVFLHDLLHMYNRELDEWYRLGDFGNTHKPLLGSSLVSDGHHCIYLVGGRTESRRRSRFLVLDVREGHFRKLPHLTLARSDLAACVFGDKIYAAGGLKHGSCKTTAVVEVYDLIAGKWSTATPMACKRRNFKLIPFENKLWAIGEPHTVPQVYDTRTDLWSPVEWSLMDALRDPTVISMLQPELTDQVSNYHVLDAFVL